MGATLPSSAQASDESARVTAPDEPTPSPSQADPSTTPIPEEPNSSLLAQREWYDSQDKIFQGLIPPETPWQDDDLSAQPTSSASPQPTLNETSTEPQAPDQEPWLLPQPDTRLFNIFGDSFELQALKEKIAKGQMPPCLYKDPAAVDRSIYRTAGKWTYWDLLPDDIRKPPPQFCNEIEDAPKQPPASRLQPKEKARPKHVPPSARPSMPPKSPRTPKKDSWADTTEQEAASQNASAQEPQAASAAADPTAQPLRPGQNPSPTPARPPESQTFLPKDSEPLPKPMPTKPAQATQPPQEQPLPADRPGSSKDDPQDLSSADPASVYKPLSGQDLHIDAFRNLDPSNWVYKAHGKVLCKRFQRNLCTVPSCKFAHLCAVRDGGKEHCAINHESKAS